jgi:hypothetical protein
MLLGSAALGALRVGDAPYPFLQITPPPPPTARIPSGHNIFIAPSSAPASTNIFFGVLPQILPQLNEPGVTLYFSVGGPPSLTTGISLVFVKPSGATYEADPALVYIGKLSLTAPAGSFQGATYLVYTFAGGELDELGPWTVYAQLGTAKSSPGSFTVVRNVSM